MKRLFWIGLWLGVWVAVQAQNAVHDTGRLEFGVLGQGFLAAGIESGAIVPNFVYPSDAPDARPLLENFSEIWVGTAQPPVASALDPTPDGLVDFGEWVMTPTGAPQSQMLSPILQEVLTVYEATPATTPQLPFSLRVEQFTYSWNDPALPESNGVVLKLIVTNQGQLPLDGVGVALATNWDVDPQILAQGKPSQDLVQWDQERQASVVFSSLTGATGLHAATVLIQGPLFAHRIAPVQTPWTFNDTARAQVLGQPIVQPETILPNNYFTFVVAGPVRLDGLNPRIFLFALVGGTDRSDLEQNIEAIAEAVTRPMNPRAEVTDEGVLIGWDPPIRTDLSGYSLLRATDPNGPYAPIGPRILETREYLDTETAPGTTYYYRVDAVDTAEQPFGVPSEPVSVQTVPKPPRVRIAGVEVLGSGYDLTVRVRVALPPDLEATDLQLQLLRNESGEPPFTPIATGPVTETLEDREIDPNRRYYYSVRLVHRSGRTGDLSEPVLVETPPAVAATPSDFGAFRVAPNPFDRSRHQEVRFENLPAPVDVFVYTITGRRLAHLFSDGPTLVWRPDPELPNGVYLFQIQKVREAVSDGPEDAPREERPVNRFGKLVIVDRMP
ncbi:MAG: hypothetical protein KatS3mg115_2216 [Candidatus Poribacteria bacterium]|nr:MAG: hypothetical protein KatS3mg115_2216 [Candidatus Poribacteria bacterium]